MSEAPSLPPSPPLQLPPTHVPTSPTLPSWPSLCADVGTAGSHVCYSAWSMAGSDCDDTRTTALCDASIDATYGMCQCILEAPSPVPSPFPSPVPSPPPASTPTSGPSYGFVPTAELIFPTHTPTPPPTALSHYYYYDDEEGATDGSGGSTTTRIMVIITLSSLAIVVVACGWRTLRKRWVRGGWTIWHATTLNPAPTSTSRRAKVQFETRRGVPAYATWRPTLDEPTSTEQGFDGNHSQQRSWDDDGGCG